MAALSVRVSVLPRGMATPAFLRSCFGTVSVALLSLVIYSYNALSIKYLIIHLRPKIMLSNVRIIANLIQTHRITRTVVSKPPPDEDGRGT